MRRNGEIVIIEDDEDDRLFLQDIFNSLFYTNKVVFIEDPTTAVSYLSDPLVNPFLIISDINMPKMDGYELRSKILADEHVNRKCIPYIFLSTSKTPENVSKAYDCQVQGYFKKEDNLVIYKAMIQSIVEYWKTSLTPSNTF
jgi:CheY-like chemotaxis protein